MKKMRKDKVYAKGHGVSLLSPSASHLPASTGVPGESVSLSFPASRSHLHPWLMVPFFKASNSRLSPFTLHCSDLTGHP